MKVIDSNGEHYQDMKVSQITGFKSGGYSKRKRPVYEDCRLCLILYSFSINSISKW